MQRNEITLNLSPVTAFVQLKFPTRPNEFLFPTPSSTVGPFSSPRSIQYASNLSKYDIYCKKGDRAKSKTTGRQRSRKRASLHEASQLYRTHFSKLLESELKAEQFEISQNRKLLSSNRKLKSDYHVYFHTKAAGTLYRNNIYDLYPQKSSNNHQMISMYKKGDLVDVIYANEQNDLKIEGIILQVLPQVVKVAFPIGTDSSQLMETITTKKIPVLLQKGANTISYQRAEEALVQFTDTNKGTEISRLVITSFTSAASENDSQTTTQHHYDNFETSSSIPNRTKISTWNEMCSSKATSISPNNMALVLKTICQNLNKSQKKAVETSLHNRLTLIQGPPGTGKTLTASHLVATAIQLKIKPILACAASNTAADNFMQKIITTCSSRTKVIRIGRTPAIQQDLWEKTLDALVEKNQTIRRARNEFSKGLLKVSDLIKLEKQISRQILQNADVIVSTCIGAGSEDLQDISFSLIIIDEATQATETDAVVSLAAGKNNARQAVLVGDQNQLPPTVLSKRNDEMGRFGLEVSLFVRLWMAGVDTQLLNTQYRMHPSLAQFPGHFFYKAQLWDGVSAKDRELEYNWNFGNVEWDNCKRVVLFRMKEATEERGRSIDAITRTSSYHNHAEAEMVLSITKQLISCDTEAATCNGVDIGIISPYSAQVRLIRDKLATDADCIDVEVGSVDGFQGREKEVIIISAVRSNQERNVGFLNDWRRLNVAITRAKRLLIVVANVQTITASRHWKEWIKWIRKHGIVINTSEC